LREVTRRGGLAALVDTDHVFDPRGAARAGVELSRVLWVRCGRRTDRACVPPICSCGVPAGHWSRSTPAGSPRACRWRRPIV